MTIRRKKEDMIQECQAGDGVTLKYDTTTITKIPHLLGDGRNRLSAGGSGQVETQWRPH